MPARGHEAWNDEDIEILKRMGGEGARLIDIARRLERTQEAVMSRARKLKVRLRS